MPSYATFGLSYLPTLLMDSTSVRRREVLASNVLFFGIVVAVAEVVRTAPAMLQKLSSLAVLLLGVLLFIGFAYAIRRGVTLVKWLFVIGQVVSLLSALVQYRTTLLPLLQTAWWPAFTYVAFFGSRLVAMVLLLPTLLPRGSTVD